MGEYADIYVDDKFYSKNEFINMKADFSDLPKYEDIKDSLPEPVWDGHSDEIKAYYKAWEIAFSNLGKPTKENGFVSPYIDAAFNGCIFMWDSCFMLMFGKYADNVFSFQKTLDNFYCKQEKDGYISREISEENGRGKFYRHDPVSTGPEIMTWCEWQYYKNYGDKDRLKKVYYPLLSYHRWLKAYHRWPDGSYWSSGWGCGMDNLPRADMEAVPGAEDWHLETFHHSFMSWVDATMQAAMACEHLILMADELGITDGVEELEDEREKLISYINDKMWDEKDGFYYDRRSNGELLKVKSAAAFWSLISKTAPAGRVERICAHLENKDEFNRKNRVPALSADHPDFSPDGHYWNGGVWPPVVYMVLTGLTANLKHESAHDIAVCNYKNMIEVFRSTGTLWENYAPDKTAPGKPAKGDFVGWTGILPITMLIEYIFGIQISADKNEIVWRINELDRHGFNNLPVGRDSYVSLVCEKRNSKNEKPVVNVKSDKKLTVKVIWNDESFIVNT